MTISISDDDEDKRVDLVLFQDYESCWNISVETALDRIVDNDSYSVAAVIDGKTKSFIVERFGLCDTQQREWCDDICREAAKLVRNFVFPLRIEDAIDIDTAVKTICAKYYGRIDIAATMHANIDIK